MTNTQRKEFITNLLDSIKADIIEEINSNQIPDNWDGHELRHLAQYKVKEAASYSRYAMRTRRLKSFKNTVRVKCL